MSSHIVRKQEPAPVARTQGARPKYSDLKSTVLGILGFSFIYFLLAKFGMALFSLEPSNITLLWLPSGIALVMCLQWRWLAAVGIFTASFAANISGLGGISDNTAIFHTIISAGADTASGLISAFLYRRYLPNGLYSAKDLLPFTLKVCLVSTFITSCILALNLVLGGYIALEQASGFIRMLILADSLGMLLILPIYEGAQDARTWTKRDATWFIGTFMVLSVMFILIQVGYSYLAFFVPPILLFLSFNAGLLLTGVMLAISMTVITGLTANGVGPLIGGNNQETNLLLVAFMFSNSLIVLGLTLQNRQLQLSEILAQSLRDAAQIDSLTRLFNRRAFFKITEKEIKKNFADPEFIYSVAMLDLDHFKEVNDTHGHAAGDQVLKTFSKELKKYSRHIDVAARIGGEEFVVFLPNCSARQARKALERLRVSFESRSICFNNTYIQSTVSIGICSGAPKMASLDEIMIRADRALYAAKDKGRNCIALDNDC